jgi:tryptophan synthase alpha chain
LSKGKKLITVYLLANFPNKEKFYKVLDEIKKSKIDYLELGIPCENPFMDGEIIANAHKLVSNRGFTEEDLKDILLYINKNIPEVKLILMTYSDGISKYNLYNYKDYYHGILCPENFINDNKANRIQIYNEELTEDEIKERLTYNKEFAYVMTGVMKTGTKCEIPKAYLETIEKIKKYSNILVQVGFGISTPEDVKMIAESKADGIIIGSELMKRVESDKLDDIYDYLISIKSVI